MVDRASTPKVTFGSDCKLEGSNLMENRIWVSRVVFGSGCALGGSNLMEGRICVKGHFFDSISSFKDKI